MTIYEIIYAIRGKLKEYVDDVNTRYSEDYLMFQVNLKRNFLLRREYNQIQRVIDNDLLATICLPLEHVNASECPECFPSEECDVVRTSKPIPKLVELNNKIPITNIGSIEMFNRPFSLISKDRIPYVGTQLYEKNIVYLFLNSDSFIYLKSQNPFYKTLDYITVDVLAQDPMDLRSYKCNSSDICYNPDTDQYPVKSWMADVIINMIVEDLAPLKSIPEDRLNNAKQDV